MGVAKSVKPTRSVVEPIGKSDIFTKHKKGVDSDMKKYHKFLDKLSKKKKGRGK